MTSARTEISYEIPGPVARVLFVRADQDIGTRGMDHSMQAAKRVGGTP